MRRGLKGALGAGGSPSIRIKTGSVINYDRIGFLIRTFPNLPFFDVFLLKTWRFGKVFLENCQKLSQN